MASPVSTIDRLTDKQRQALTDLILNGHSMRSVAEQCGVSIHAVSRYKQRVILPSLRTANRLMAVERFDKPQATQAAGPVAQAAQIAENRAVAAQIVGGSPLRSRLERLWERIDRLIDKAEIADAAPLINQAHKNLELLGRATGEFVERATASSMPQVMQVLMMPLVTQPPPEPASDPANKIIDAPADPAAKT